MKTMPLSLGNIILLKEKGGMRESIPRQVDKRSRRRKGFGALEAEIGVWNFQGGKDKYLFLSLSIH